MGVTATAAAAAAAAAATTTTTKTKTTTGVGYTVGYATTKRFYQLKSGCYNERGRILSADVVYGKFDYSFHYEKTVYAFQIYMYSV